MQRSRRRWRGLFLAAWCGGMLMPMVGGAAQESAEDSGPVQAAWKTQEIRYSYTGFTTAYDCNAAEDRLKAILRAVGAHEQTKVSAQGCELNRPSRNFFVTITTATPVPATDVPKGAVDSSREDLLKRLGVPSKKLDEIFPAEWKTVQLSKDRKLNLQPGDCELMQGLQDHVLPKLSVKIVSQRIQCVPRQLPLLTPELTVEALVPVKTADQTKS
ncbi:MAG TPA: hypothetical protein VGE08_15945 [Steroidobacter sp.]|uniref:hypothetical protein n=1 Tax=Steroidobacter sp. TaxID=1978227 RepID=UPI002EDBB0C2